MAEKPRIRKVPKASRRVRYSEQPLEAESPSAAAAGQAGTPQPERAVENTDRAWGDEPDSNDDRLKNNRPPHWG